MKQSVFYILCSILFLLSDLMNMDSYRICIGIEACMESEQGTTRSQVYDSPKNFGFLDHISIYSPLLSESYY
jgi:hypothetical protein